VAFLKRQCDDAHQTELRLKSLFFRSGHSTDFNVTDGDTLLPGSWRLTGDNAVIRDLNVLSELDPWKLSHAIPHVLDISNASSPGTGMALPAATISALRRRLL
jgi:hypothetical protein